MENSKAIFPTLSYAESVNSACEKADLVMVLTEWSEFTEIDPAELSKLVRQKTVIDGRMCLKREWWTDCGWTYLT